MTRRRRKTRGKRGEERPWTLLAILGIAVLVGAATAFAPAGAFTSAALDRPGQMDVSLEGAGALQMSIADCMDDNGWNDMITVTNRLNTTADVTVALHDPSKGDLKGGSGGSHTVNLAQGASNTYEFKYSGSGPYPDTIGFDVTANGTGLTADATRSSAVDSDGVGCDGGSTTTSTSTATTTTTSGVNTPPTADFTFTRQNRNFVDLDGSPSSDPDGSIVTYEWDVGNDGTIDHTGQTVTKVRATSGTEIRLIVTDDDGATDSVTKTV
jgi:hypothetical protein